MTDRKIALKIGTTGFQGKVISIAAVEIFDDLRIGNTCFRYIFPHCDVERAAHRVNGMTQELLLGQEAFNDVFAEIFAFIDKAPVIVQNPHFILPTLRREQGLTADEAPLDSQILSLQAAFSTQYPKSAKSLQAICKTLIVADERPEGLASANVLAHQMAESWCALKNPPRRQGLRPRENGRVVKKRALRGYEQHPLFGEAIKRRRIEHEQRAAAQPPAEPQQPAAH